MEEEVCVQCPVCGSALEPVTMQQGIYDCPNCGEVEEDEDGFIVNGQFYPVEATDRDGFGEVDSGDADNDFGDSEDEGIISKALAGFDADAEELDDCDDDDDDIGNLADMEDIGFALDVPDGDIEEDHAT